jgi:hypothetical protein
MKYKCAEWLIAVLLQATSVSAEKLPFGENISAYAALNRHVNDVQNSEARSPSLLLHFEMHPVQSATVSARLLGFTQLYIEEH